MYLGRLLTSSWYFLIFLALLPGEAVAGPIDSLKKIVAGLPASEKPAVFNEIFMLSGPYMLNDSALFYAEQARDFAIRNKDDFNAAYAYRNIGMYYSLVSNPAASIENYYKALEYLARVDDVKRTSVIYHELSNVLVNNNRYEEGAKILFEALAFCESKEYTPGIIKMNHSIGGLYRQLNKLDEAVAYLEKAWALENEQEKPNFRSMTQICKTLGLVRYDQKRYEDAIQWLDRAAQYQKGQPDNRELMMINNSLAMTYSSMDQPDKAMDHYALALEFAEKTGIKDLITAALLNIGREFMIAGKYEQAVTEIQKGLQLADEYGFTKWQRNANIYLTNCYEAMGDPSNALKAYKKYRQYDDSLNIANTQFKIAELETQYETEKKERQIEWLNRENEIQSLRLRQNRIALAISLFLLGIILLIGLAYYKQLRKRQKIELILKKQELEKKLMSAVISTEEKERKRFAADLHDGLGPLLSSIKLYLSGLEEIKDESRTEMVNYARELTDESISSVRTIANNILPVELSEKGLIASLESFAGKLQFTRQIEIDIVDDSGGLPLEPSVEIILYRVVQELINNSLKHAEAKKIHIRFDRENQLLKIQYQDDGIGFDPEATLLKPDGGQGLKNIRQRIESLNGKMEIQSRSGEGTRVAIRINLES